MNRSALFARVALVPLLGIASLLASPGVQAQQFRAYLSSTGSDSNPCTLAAPCRLLPAALIAIVDGGQVWMLDSANYNTGPVSVGKSASILAVPGAVGSLITLGGNALNLNAPNVSVSLRNLVITAFPGSSGSGIQMTANSRLVVESTLIDGVSGAGIDISAGQLELVDSTIRNVGGYAVAVTGVSKASITGSRLLKNAQGGIRAESVAGGTTTVNVANSLLSGTGGSGEEGIRAINNANGGFCYVTVSGSTIQYMGYGLEASLLNVTGIARITVGTSVIANNIYAFMQNNGMIRSYGNNQFHDNSNSYGSLTPIASQ